MKNDRKGTGGMLESMFAVMIVIVTLTVFMGMFCYIQADGTVLEKENFEFIEKLEIREGSIVGDIHDDIVYLTESNGYSMTEVNVNVIGDVSQLTFNDSFGENRTENVDVHNGTFDIRSDDGRSLLANYEVIIWS